MGFHLCHFDYFSGRCFFFSAQPDGRTEAGPDVFSQMNNELNCYLLFDFVYSRRTWPYPIIYLFAHQFENKIEEREQVRNYLMIVIMAACLTYKTL